MKRASSRPKADRPKPRPQVARRAIGPNKNARRPVSRVLFRPERRRRSFLWTAHCWTVLATYPDASGGEPCGRTRATSLFGLAPGGACHAADVAADAVGSYPTLSPFPGPEPRRFAFCGAIPRVTPGGSYPPPFHRGARTFLDRASPAATARPSDGGVVVVCQGGVNDLPPFMARGGGGKPSCGLHASVAVWALHPESS